jgi:hypothetical protein
MGSTFTSYQIRSEDQPAAVAAMTPLAGERAYVSPPDEGWITLYDEVSDEQSEDVIRRTAMALSRKLKASVLAFLVHDGSTLIYLLYRNGQIIDEFNSNADQFDAETRERYYGNASELLPLCTEGMTLEQVDALMHPRDEAHRRSPEGQLQGLAAVLGIDDRRVALGFCDFLNEGAETLDDADTFEPIGDGAARHKPKPAFSPEDADVIPPDTETFAHAVTLLCTPFKDALGSLPDDKMRTAMIKGMDKEAARLLRLTKITNPPTLDELKSARDGGPAALANFLHERVPDQLNDVAAIASVSQPQLLSALLDLGVDPNGRNGQGILPLCGVIQAKHLDLVRRLIGMGADVNARSSDGWCPMLGAAATGSTETIQLLLDAGAKVNVQGRIGQTPLSLAERHGKDSEPYRLIRQAAEREQQRSA